ncbi:MAG: ATP-binding protein [Candidatus Nitrosocosmicus sp.]
MAKNEDLDCEPKTDAASITDSITKSDDNLVIGKPEKLYSSDAVIKRTINDFQKIKQRLDNCTDSTGPSVFLNTPVWKEFVNLKDRGIKLRFITEITKYNIACCKELLKITELRHLDDVKGNFGISDGTYYFCSSSIREGKTTVELVYSNVKTFVDQQQFFFETLWNKSISAEQKIKEIENGNTFGIWTKLLQDKDEIIRELFCKNSNANELSICTTIGGLEMSYNYLLDSYKNILKKYSEGTNKGLRIVLNIDRKSIYLVKKFLDFGAQIRHIKNFPHMSFGVSDRDVAITIEKMEGGKKSKKFLLSTEPLYIDHFNNVFEELWNKGIDAKKRIRSIEQGFELENVEIIYNSTESIKRAWEMVKSAKEEVLLLFSSSNALQRQLKMGVTNLLKEVYDVPNINLKLLVPTNIDISDIVSELKLDFPYVDIRTADERLKTKITILVIDRKESIVWEVKDDNPELSSFEAVGIAAYTNMKAISLSYASIFDSLWMQTDMYEKLKQTEQMQKEFLDIAAHELRTPIQPIINIIDILRLDIKKNNNRILQSELLDIAKRNAKRLMNLTESILDVTRIECNTLNIKTEIVNLIEIILHVIQYFTDELEKHGDNSNIYMCEYLSDIAKRKNQGWIKRDHLDLTLKSTERKLNLYNEILVHVDRDKIVQVLHNLLGNANKFTKGGKISIIVNVVENQNSDGKRNVIVTIKDSGAGISPDIFPKLFTKFASKSFQGTGLGLYISKNIIEAHGGNIWAENNKDEPGASFSFSLPLVDIK